jgi:hypothetical protein
MCVVYEKGLQVFQIKPAVSKALIPLALPMAVETERLSGPDWRN